jgi:integrase
MLELRKRHLKKCEKYVEGSPFSADLDCKRCPYFAFGKLDGRKVRQSLGTSNREEASRKLLKMDADEKGPNKLTVADAVERFTADRENSGYAPKSIVRYKYSLQRLITFLAGNGVAQLRAVTVDDLSAWKATWATQTALGKQKEQERIRTFFRWCRKRDYIDRDPTEGLTRVRAEVGGKRERFTDAEITKIFELIPEVYPDQQEAAKVRAFLLVLRYTALRIGDATNLQKIHLNGDRLLLRTLKTGQPVFTVVPAVVVDALKGIENGNEYYFFPGHTNTLETWKKKWSLILQPLYEKAGVRFRSHAWRDTLVFKLLQSGVNIELIARLLGHASSAITWRYYAAWVPELQERADSGRSGALIPAGSGAGFRRKWGTVSTGSGAL